MNEKADNAIAVAATVATVAIPIPFADALLLIGEQVTLMATICGIYGMGVNATEAGENLPKLAGK